MVMDSPEDHSHKGDPLGIRAHAVITGETPEETANRKRRQQMTPQERHAEFQQRIKDFFGPPSPPVEPPKPVVRLPYKED